MNPPKPIRVVVDGYEWPHVVACSVMERWIEVLVHDRDGNPIYRDGKWLVERLPDMNVTLKEQLK